MNTLDLTKALIRYPSVTPHDAGCQGLLIQLLADLGFEITSVPHQQTQNFWATHGQGGPLIVFAGHTDVVSTGDLSHWQFPPFEPTEFEGKLYGRGAADMKGSLAAMLTAVSRYIQQYPTHAGTIGFLITSAEEGPSETGTPIVLDYLAQQGINIDYCIVGEPTCVSSLGDTIKNGRRGSLTGNLILRGKQGHIAYPHLALNPIHAFSPILHSLVEHKWDQGNEFFSPTSFQISNIQAGTGLGNVIPGELNLMFNFRYSPVLTAEMIKQQTEKIITQHHADFELKWTHYGEPFLTQPGKLTHAISQAIQTCCHQAPTLSTSGGTSDARYIAKTGAQVIEFGPINATIHQINEHVLIKDLDSLSEIYHHTLANLLSSV